MMYPPQVTERMYIDSDTRRSNTQAFIPILYRDKLSILPEHRGLVGAIIEKGVLVGYADKTFKGLPL